MGPSKNDKMRCCVLRAEMRCAVLSCVQLCVTPGTVSHRDPLSMGFPQQEHRVVAFPSPRLLPSPELAGEFFTTVLPGEPQG